MRSPRAHAQHTSAEPDAAPAPQAAPPQPKGTGCLLVLKQVYRDWIAAGGTPINGWV